MAKICPQCENENPSKANVCMSCGTRLVENAETDKWDALHSELSEAKKDIRFYKKSFEEALTKIEELKNNASLSGNDVVKELEEQLTTQNRIQEDLQNQISEQNKEIEQWKNKKKNKIWILFLLISIGLTISCGILCFNLDNTRRENSNEKDNLENRISNFEKGINNLREEKQTTEQEKEKLQQKIDEISYYYPIIIKSIKVGNVYKNGTVETDFGNKLYSSNAMYLKPQIEYIGLTPSQTITLYLKLYREGELPANSPSLYSSTKCDIYLSNEETVELTGCGYEDKGNWIAGNYCYEIWYKDMCLKTVNFTLY